MLKNVAPPKIQSEYDPNKLSISEVDVRTKHFYKSHNKGNQTFEEMIEFCNYVARDERFYKKDYHNAHIGSGIFERYLEDKREFKGIKRFFEFFNNKHWQELNPKTYDYSYPIDNEFL